MLKGARNANGILVIEKGTRSKMFYFSSSPCLGERGQLCCKKASSDRWPVFYPLLYLPPSMCYPERSWAGAWDTNVEKEKPRARDFSVTSNSHYYEGWKISFLGRGQLSMADFGDKELWATPASQISRCTVCVIFLPCQENRLKSPVLPSSHSRPSKVTCDLVTIKVDSLLTYKILLFKNSPSGNRNMEFFSYCKEFWLGNGIQHAVSLSDHPISTFWITRPPL